MNVIMQTELNKSVIKNLKLTLRSKIPLFFNESPTKFGGPGVIVQIDAWKLNFNVKSHQGAVPSNLCCAVYIVDTSSTQAKWYVEIVECMNAAPLIEVIIHLVRPNSKIHTDKWRVYSHCLTLEDISKEPLYTNTIL